jgi:DNA-binding beta-propeller fold protein YncE
VSAVRGVAAVVGLALGSVACSSTTPAPGQQVAPLTHSGPIALSPDGSRIYVVHPDLDLVTVLDPGSGSILFQISLATTPTPDESGRYTPAVEPRALALDPTGKTLFVSGERSGHVYSFDAASGSKLGDALACSEPIGILTDKTGQNVFVACSNDDMIVELAAAGLGRIGSASCPHKPWALAWGQDGTTLLSTHLLGWPPGPASSSSTSPGVSTFTTTPLAFASTWTVPDGPAADASTVPHGQVRGIYDAVVRPGTSELWVVHMMLGTNTNQPILDFQSTVFPAVTLLDGSGSELARLTVSTTPGDGAAFGDVVSGPRALTFSPDGLYAFIVDADSEDILVVDARQRVEAALVRPLPGHMPEGAVWGPGNKLYVQERNSEDIVVLDIVEDGYSVSVTPEPHVLGTLTSDTMPASLRLGQHLFYSANSDELPLTSNHWVACATCHLEGRSDAVTWRFAQGPRDTPSNAGGTLDTGFLFRTADRNRVQDYWKTIDVEQGGDFSADASIQVPLLDALADYVNHAIPVPVPPTQDPSAVLAGKQVFASQGCPACHYGAALTDSGQGNPSLDLADPVVSELQQGGVLLHDIGTCVTTPPWPDVAHDTIDGYPRDACRFDTPALRGLWDSAPYLHDGSAATLDDAVQRIVAGVGGPSLSASDELAIVTYLKSL